MDIFEYLLFELLVDLITLFNEIVGLIFILGNFNEIVGLIFILGNLGLSWRNLLNLV